MRVCVYGASVGDAARCLQYSRWLFVGCLAVARVIVHVQEVERRSIEGGAEEEERGSYVMMSACQNERRL